MNEEIMPPEDNLEIAIDEAAKNLAPTRSRLVGTGFVPGFKRR